MENSPIWTPNPAQEEFLAADDFEVLFGGQAGGGKTDALLIDALGLQQAAPLNPHYSALLLRRTFPQLKDVITRGRELYPQLVRGATYHEQAREFRFPSGAKVELGFLERDADKYQYQGRSFHWIGIDELTQLEMLATYTYLLSRCRSTDPALKTYMRASCNPGGIGHAWVKARFAIQADGAPTQIDTYENGIPRTRRFIPAKLSENVYLSNDGEYKANLMQLPAAEQRALLDGRWDIEDEASILITPASVSAARTTPPGNAHATGPLLIGLDPAYKGKDNSSLICRRGAVAFRLTRYPGADQMALANNIAVLIKELGPFRVYIDYGYGLGVHDRLVELGYGHIVRLVNFGERADDPTKYYNRRAEIYGRMAEWLAPALNPTPRRIPDDDALAAQLVAIPFERTGDHVLKIRPKEEIKKMIGRSPDDADALALTFTEIHAGDFYAQAEHPRTAPSAARRPQQFAQSRF